MRNRRLLTTLAVLAFAPAASAQFNSNGTTTQSLTVDAAAAIRIDSATTTLATAGNTVGNPYTGTTSFTYQVSTGNVSGTASVALQITSDFNPAGGPSVAGGDLLTYTCAAASGTPCPSAQTASSTSPTSVVTFGANAHSAGAGDAGSTA